MVSWSVLEPQIEELGGFLKAFTVFSDRQSKFFARRGNTLSFDEQMTGEGEQVLETYRYADQDGTTMLIVMARRFWAEEGEHRWYCYDTQIVRQPKFVTRAIGDATHKPTRLLTLELGEEVASWPEVDRVDLSQQT